ncbi:sulfite exporter TauE/SafE family protein [Neoroseomonas soli]|uniref:Probable membrane transporter protein n=1 Tax=Neoroseomonas soli TaxID=1081025 RepID=A0A9X9X2E8_9PROT|nr:sulfite exporter TauE/SafE family protein [Neoroseomonas soli]MBR0673577.1 sulfite exporter TauE/SafE family protein [Neoroseomonas soli]
MDITGLQALLAGVAGGMVGFVLALVGGGGSILAVPLLVHVVGMRQPHLAIGTSAVAVALNAATGLIGHARAGNVRWPCASVFAAAGIAGAAAGAAIGKRIDGQVLLAAFAVLMLVVAVLMLRRKESVTAPAVRLSRGNAPALAGIGGATGLASGFFGIGGGFLVMPGLVAATGMSTLQAIGSSLVAVTAFGATTALSYALSGLVDWTVAALFVAGGIAGSFGGTAAARRLGGRPAVLTRLFAVMLAGIAVAMLVRGMG